MKLSGPNPQPSFSLSLAPASNPFTLPQDLHPLHPPFSTIIPCRSLHCQSKGPRGGKEGRGRCVYVCARLCAGICVYVCIYSTCAHGLTFGIEYVLACTNRKHHVPVHTHAGAGCFKVGSRLGGFPTREPAASNHMSGEGGSSGSRPGLGGNQQHMNRI